MDRIEENSKKKVNLRRCVLSFEQNVDRDNELHMGVWWEGVPESWSNDKKWNKYRTLRYTTRKIQEI